MEKNLTMLLFRKSIADCDCAICQKGRDIKRKMKKKDDVLTKTVCTKCEG